MAALGNHQEEKGAHSTIPPHFIENGSSVDALDKDIAATIVSEHAQSVDPQVERRVLRKIDLLLIPWMWIGYGFVYYDKACIPLGSDTIDKVVDLSRRFWAAPSSLVWPKTFLLAL